jgi:hypothetical protein
MNMIEYQAEFGDIVFPDGFEQKLSGKTIEEQMAFYRIEEVCLLSSYSYGELDSRSQRKLTHELDKCHDVEELIIKNGLLVGVTIRDYANNTQICLPGQYVTTYIAIDDDGVGSESREDTCSLVCL